MPEPGVIRHREALLVRLGNDAVRWDEDSLAQHSRDTWCVSVLRGMRGTLTARPLCIVTPATAEEISETLQYATQNGLPVVPFGGGSGVCGGVLPAEGSLVIDLRRMHRIVELNETALTVRVQAGMMGNVFEAALNAAGYTMRNFPQSIDLSTVGGWVSTRAAGQYSTRYGSMEDMLLALEVVLPDGHIVRTRVGPRSATGPDVRNIFLGA